MTTPFSRVAAGGYPGLALPRSHSYDPTARRFWLGRPGNMKQLPSPQPGYQVALSQAEAVYTLANGRKAVRALGTLSREWPLTFAKLVGRDLATVVGFYRRSFGRGPWAFLPPEDTNRLTLAQSMCGAVNAVAEGWAPTAGTVVYDSTQTPAMDPCGVLRWSGAGSGSLLGAGALAGGAVTVDPLTATPYVPAEAFTGSVWLKVASGTPSARAQLLGLAADGVTVVATVSGASVGLSGAVAELDVSAAAGALGAAVYVTLAVQCQTAAAPDLLLSCAQLQLGSRATGWLPGMGVPRVVWTTAPSMTVDSLYAGTVPMTLSEA